MLLIKKAKSRASIDIIIMIGNLYYSSTMNLRLIIHSISKDANVGNTIFYEIQSKNKDKEAKKIQYLLLQRKS